MMSIESHIVKKRSAEIFEKGLYECKTRDFDVERFYTSVWAPFFLHRKHKWQRVANMQCMVLEITLYGHILQCSR